MADSEQHYVSLRPAGTSERRCIMRHALGYYRGLIVAGRYTAPAGFPVRTKEAFYPALKHCVSTHAMLSAAIKGELTEAPELIRPATINLANHVEIAESVVVTSPENNDSDGTHAELEAIKPALCRAHDQRFTDIERVPPWRIVVVPLVASATTQPTDAAPHAFYLLFTYSHSHGDGPSGLYFHRTFLSALRNPSTLAASASATTSLSAADPVVHPGAKPALLPPVERTTTLPITWLYLLLPVASSYLPTAVRSRLPLAHLFRAAVSPHVPAAWTGLSTVYPGDDDAETKFSTGVAFAVAPPAVVAGMLAACRRHSGVKLTGALHGVIVRALSAALPPAGSGSSAFVAQTAIDLRHLMPRYGAELASERNWDGAVGLCTSVAYHTFPRDEGDVGAVGCDGGEDLFWRRARETTRRLAERASTLVDQPIGLLKYLSSYREWLQGQLGKAREASWEVSNVMVCDPDPGEAAKDGAKQGERTEEGWQLQRLVFSQPANATGAAVNFNVVTRKGGDMVVTLSWQKGVLGVEGDEDVWARGVCESLERGMTALAGVE